MQKQKRGLSFFLATVFTGVSILSGCGSAKTDNTTENTKPAENDSAIELALNVYYNDPDTGYYENESGESIFINSEGQYTLTFDCSKDLSEKAKSAGVTSLTNLTAVYLLDMGSVNGTQSSLKECNILYDEILVDDVKLTITQTEPKSAFKNSGLFDTNDPINAWDGSCVKEVSSNSEHKANFTTVKNPTVISVTFTLSDLKWGTDSTETSSSDGSSELTNPSVFHDLDFSSMDALTLSKYLGNGINLGNTMESYGRATLGTQASVSSYETYWGNPVTTAEMIRGMKNCGFDTLRIPVAWTNAIQYEDGDYTISKAYLDRIEELVNYALDAEMFVILNDHWDGGWWAKFGSSSKDTVASAWEMYESIWTQIAERFQDYNEMLIFESANEELGDGLNDTTDWSDSGSLSKDELYEVSNAINQKFVDLIRSSGGKNQERFLLIAGINTNIKNTCDNRFIMPTDTVDGKLLVSVHFYEPWSYCCDKEIRTVEQLAGYKWGLLKEFQDMETELEKMSKFTDAGYGVIIGEYGALPAFIDGKSYEIENTAEYTDYLLDICDIHNFCPILWDTGGLFDRSTYTLSSTEVTEVFQSHSYAAEKDAGASYLEAVAEEMKSYLASAPDHWEGQEVYEAGTPVCWIMWNGGAGTYSVGNVFNAADNTAGITASNTIAKGAGEYTVSLDFAEANSGLTFAALAIADGNVLYPDAIIKIKEVSIDGTPVSLQGIPYTCSDDGICLRVNLYNSWVTELPDDARTATGRLEGASPTILNPQDTVGIKNITVTFELITE